MTAAAEFSPSPPTGGLTDWQGLPAHASGDLSPLARKGVLAAMLGAHLLGGWALLQVPAVRQAAAEVAPIMVDLIAPTPEAPKPAPPPPPKVEQRRTPPPPAPVLAAKPKPVAEKPPAFTAPPPPLEPPKLVEPTAPPTPPAPPAPEPAPPSPPAPPAPAPAPAPAAPRAVVLTDSDWIRVPDVDYPVASRRLQEEGTVVVKAIIDTHGVPKKVSLHRSSGYSRLDQEALAKARTARVKPRTENGVPFEFSILMPLEFKLED